MAIIRIGGTRRTTRTLAPASLPVRSLLLWLVTIASRSALVTLASENPGSPKAGALDATVSAAVGAPSWDSL